MIPDSAGDEYPSCKQIRVNLFNLRAMAHAWFLTIFVHVDEKQVLWLTIEEVINMAIFFFRFEKRNVTALAYYNAASTERAAECDQSAENDDSSGGGAASLALRFMINFFGICLIKHWPSQ